MIKLWTSKREYKKYIKKIREFFIRDAGPEADLSPDKKLLGVAYDSRKAYVYDIVSGKKVATFKRSHRIYDIFFPPAGNYVVTIGIKVAAIWDLSTYDKIASLSIPDEIIFVVFSPDGKYLALTSNTFSTVFTSRGELVREFIEHYPCYTSFAPDGDHFVYADNHKAVIENIHTGKKIIFRENFRVEGAGVSRDMRHIIIAGKEHVSIWDVSQKKQIRKFRTNDSMFGIRFTSDYLRAAVVGEWSDIILDTTSWEKITTINREMEAFDGYFVANGEYLAVMGLIVEIYETLTGHHIFTIGHSKNISSIAAREDYLVTAGFDGHVAIWQLKGRKVHPYF